MREEYKIIELQPERLVDTAMRLKRDLYRLVQICAVRIESGYELTYSFAKEYEFLNYRLVINEDVVVTSISGVFETAFLYENEMKDLFGVNIDLINLDYKGNLYRIEKPTPYKE
ncbi:NADH-quinone oxidoreductase subunit C [Anaerosacchariphilus polymeriproducens]|uniref:NADH-quinone oxidoreductase subunit C n=1 Tax=Anaerosacchariphilus polymeriproducens TaxID=1812858 RepID=A0A371ATR9_9FIRM|nr:NADH-quinone oxidoreductase subunit C [Anaerosacchariphilus polymeriproducens]RDU22963.1 NADH-quinone oxidoreductase subunit C [Anaerosacchariphilus polymeriproducens]